LGGQTGAKTKLQVEHVKNFKQELARPTKNTTCTRKSMGKEKGGIKENKLLCWYCRNV